MMISPLEEKLASARARQRTLIANHQSAVNRKRVEEKIYKVNTSGAFARFEQYEQRIDRWNAEAEVMHTSNVTLDQKFADLAHNHDVEAELTRLKEQVGGAKKAEPKAKAATAKAS